MLISTSDTLPGKRIARVIGLAKGNTIRSRNLGRDFIAVLRNAVGGEIVEYTKLLAESREQALDRMTADAERLGANAVIGMRFSTSQVMEHAAELLAYGTAVVVEDER